MPNVERGELTISNMPHLKVNVNGKRYTISGLTRATCSKQILCALAKVDAELQASKGRTEERNHESNSENSANEVQGERPRQARELRRKVKNEDKYRTCKGAGDFKGKYGKRHSNRRSRSIKQIAKVDSKGIQTSNAMLEKLVEEDETQQHCSSELHDEKDLKDFESCSQKVKERKTKDTDLNGVKDTKETDHDTGISELHSDSSFDTTQVLNNAEKENLENRSSVKKNLNCAPFVEVKCASTNTDPIETADAIDARTRGSETANSSVDDFIVAQLLGSETDVENDDESTCSCIYVDSDSEVLEVGIFKARGDLKLTETKIAEQNKMIEALNALINADQTNAKELFACGDGVTKRIDELKQSITLSNQLYDYQRVETRANALELDRVESQIRRKRWHVESLLKELRGERKVSPVGRVPLRNDTLV